MGNLTENNLVPLTTQLKYGQRCIRIGDTLIPVGVGGSEAPGASSDSSSIVEADIILGVVNQQGMFQAFRFDGTTPSDSGEPEEVAYYKSWKSTLPSPQPSPSGGISQLDLFDWFTILNQQ